MKHGLRTTPGTVRCAQRGVSLVEVLVAVIILSVGMLGQAMFMITASKNVQQSRYRAVAGHYAEELFGLALADTGNRKRYEIDDSGCVSGWTHCTQWLARLTRDLPQREGSPVSAGLDDDGRMVVSIRWRDPGGEEQVHTAISHMELISE